MKTSFYFVLWIAIYPILSLIGIYNNEFYVAFFAIWGLSWLLNHVMPKTLIYEKASEDAPILEDVYTGNVASFSRRLSRDAAIQIVAGVYFAVTVTFIIIMLLNGGFDGLLELVIFGIFAYGAISRSVSLLSAKSQLRANPTPEQCMDIADETYRLDYATYYENRVNAANCKEALPPRPRYFTAFRIFSIIFAVISSLLGTIYLISSIYIMISNTYLEAETIALIGFLYGALAIYYGVIDFISCIRNRG